MRMMIVFLMLVPGLAHADSWVDSIRRDLLRDCGKKTRLEFSRKYGSLLARVLKLPPDLQRSSYIKVLFPQALPAKPSLNGLYLSCFGFMNDFLIGKSQDEARAAKESWIQCLDEDQGEELNPIRDELVVCLKSLKD